MLPVGVNYGRKKLSRKEREKLWRRGQILETALDLFSENEYHNVSMREIARKAEFATGTLYKFFKRERGPPYLFLSNGKLRGQIFFKRFTYNFIEVSAFIFGE